MSYLTKIFDPATKAKARRDWRVLFVDGLGSHINMNFLNWCMDNTAKNWTPLFAKAMVLAQ